MQKIQLLFIVVIATQILNAQTGTNGFGGGNGTEANPFEIYTKEHLEALADSVNSSAPSPIDNWSKGKYFKLMNDINDSVRTVIGKQFHRFEGFFDGQNCKIILAIDAPKEDYIGLFGNLLGAVIKNIIVGGYVNGNIMVGGIAGFSYDVSITNCINLANISGHLYVSGISGFSYNASIIDCMNVGNINGYIFIGGFVGLGYGVSMINCMNSGNVNGDGVIGGIIGQIAPLQDISLNSSITNCMNLGNISGGGAIGGIAGLLYNDNDNTLIANCMNAGSIIGYSNIGGIIGNTANNEATITDCINVGIVEGEREIKETTGAIVGEE